jgi:hypothetical protein
MKLIKLIRVPRQAITNDNGRLFFTNQFHFLWDRGSLVSIIFFLLLLLLILKKFQIEILIFFNTYSRNKSVVNYKKV